MKFRPHQKVVVRNFLINDNRMDIGADVQRYLFSPESKTWKVEVRINSVMVLLDEDRLVDYEEYWDELRKKESEEE